MDYMGDVQMRPEWFGYNAFLHANISQYLINQFLIVLILFLIPYVRDIQYFLRVCEYRKRFRIVGNGIVKIGGMEFVSFRYFYYGIGVGLLIYIIYLSGQLIQIPFFLIGASRYWIGGTGMWSDTAHWSETSGGLGGASVPSELDDVIIDANSGNGTITLNVHPSIRSLNCNNANITISAGSATITMNGGDWTWTAGTFSYGTSTLVWASSGTMDIHGTGRSYFNITINAGQTLTIPGSEVYSSQLMCLGICRNYGTIRLTADSGGSLFLAKDFNIPNSIGDFSSDSNGVIVFNMNNHLDFYSRNSNLVTNTQTITLGTMTLVEASYPYLSRFMLRSYNSKSTFVLTQDIDISNLMLSFNCESINAQLILDTNNFSIVTKGISSSIAPGTTFIAKMSNLTVLNTTTLVEGMKIQAIDVLTSNITWTFNGHVTINEGATIDASGNNGYYVRVVLGNEVIFTNNGTFIKKEPYTQAFSTGNYIGNETTQPTNPKMAGYGNFNFSGIMFLNIDISILKGLSITENVIGYGCKYNQSGLLRTKIKANIPAVGVFAGRW